MATAHKGDVTMRRSQHGEQLVMATACLRCHVPFQTCMHEHCCAVAGAASVRVSNELGANRPAAARLAAQSAAVLALTLMAGCAVLLASLHRVLPLIITSDPAVIEGTQRVVPIVAYMLIGDGVNAVLAGVVRGCGQQAKGVHPCIAMLFPDRNPLQHASAAGY